MAKLKKTEVEQLLKMEFTKEDVDYIETVLPYFIFEDENDKKVSLASVRKKLSLEDFCSGLARATYHWNAVRDGIYFDASNWFRD